MSLGAIIFMSLGLVILWGGFFICASIAMKNQ
ncbi:MetS family NSS transporter small subunit [Longirhabdus pacifica]